MNNKNNVFTRFRKLQPVIKAYFNNENIIVLITGLRSLKVMTFLFVMNIGSKPWHLCCLYWHCLFYLSNFQVIIIGCFTFWLFVIVFFTLPTGLRISLWCLRFKKQLIIFGIDCLKDPRLKSSMAHCFFSWM